MQQVENLPDDPGNPGEPGGTPGTPPPPSSYGTAVFEFPFTKADAESAVDITAYLNCYNQDDLRFSAYMFIDDTLVQVGTTNALYDQPGSQAQQTMTMVAILTGINAGPHNFQLRLKNRETEGPLIVMAGSLVKIAELRQGAR